MTKRTLGKTGYEIAPVAFGGIINTNETQADADRYVAYAIERGVNYFDVAPTYGNAEERLGAALKPYRKNVYLACKTALRDAKGSKEELLASLGRLQTDYFDVYQLHSIKNGADVEQAFSAGGAMETLRWAKEEGLIRAAGITAHSEEYAVKCLDLFDFDSVLYTMYWVSGALNGNGAKLAAAVKAKNAGLLCMKVLAHRMWRDGEKKRGDKSWYKPIDLGADGPLALAAMKYCLSREPAALVPPGIFEYFCFMLDHIDEAIANPLSAGEMDLLKTEAAKLGGEAINLVEV